MRKTKGFDIEAVRMVDAAPFENLAVAILIAAVQMLQTVRDRDGTNKRSPDDVFEPADQPVLEAICPTREGKTAKQKNPMPKAAWHTPAGSAPVPCLRRGMLADGPNITASPDPSSCWAVITDSKQWVMAGGWDDLCESGGARLGHPRFGLISESITGHNGETIRWV
jgi:hypothetical protein